MTVTAKHEDKVIYFDPEDRLWRYQDTDKSVFEDWAEKPCPNCKCGTCGREATGVVVILKDGSKDLRFVDSCIAPLIKELNLLGIKTTSSSCCGHGKEDGELYIPKEFIEEEDWAFKIKIPRRKIK